MRFKDVYLDSGASTEVDPKVFKVMSKFFTNQYGNASSSHNFGSNAKEALEHSRSIIAKSLRAKPDEIAFTSGGTESNNFAIKGIAFANKSKGNHIITTKIEHKCILNSCHWLEKQGFDVTYLDVDSEGFVHAETLEKAITDKTILVSIIHGNNEIGTIQDLEALGKVCKKHNVYFHTDACQSYTKVPIDVKKLNIDLITINSHKIHGPKGVGALYIRKGTNIDPWQHGGSHEGGMRAGTENIHGIVGFSEAVKLAFNKKHIKYMRSMLEKLISGVLEIEGVKLNGASGDKRLCNNANFCFTGVDGESLGGYLNSNWIATSKASACSGITSEPSYVLQALGLSEEDIEASLRLTISRFTTEDEIDYAIKILKKAVPKFR